MQTIHIASDHAGYALKELLVQFLAQKGINVVDDGTHSTESCDYPVPVSYTHLTLPTN